MTRLTRIFILISFLISILFTPVTAATIKPVRAKNAMVVTSEKLATAVGVDVLKKGGNAVDAAVAVAFTLAVTYPTAGNIGGGGFMVIRSPNGETTTIDFREKAPLQARRDMYLDEHGEIIRDASITGYLASGVPGSVAGLELAHKKYGQLKWRDLIEPAIQYAKKGIAVSRRFAGELNRLEDTFIKFPASHKKFSREDGEPWQENDIFKQPNLARSLKLIAKDGAAAFYNGKIADWIADDMQKNGGIITRADLAKYSAVERPPVFGDYRGYKIISMGPPSSGGIAIIQMLNVLEQFQLRNAGYHSSEYVHLMTETFRRVYYDRAQFLADMDFADVPLPKLASQEYAIEIAESIADTALPSLDLSADQRQLREGDHTTHFSIVDENQMVVAVTTTINSGYGSKVVIENAGFLMNNEMDDFAVSPGKPNYYGLVSYEVNAIAPEKRMLSSMSPTIILKDDKPYLTVGAMGGSRIITSVLQIILNLLEHDMNVQEAVDAPRIHHQWLPDVISCERFAIPQDVLLNLQRKGHRIDVTNDYFAEAHGILVDEENGILFGAVDSRYTGSAQGY